MNKHIARFYTSVIKNEIKRKKIYNILTNSIADNISLDDINSNINKIFKFMILKEIAPDLLDNFKINMYDINDNVYNAYKTNLIWQKDINDIRNQYSIEYDFLTNCLTYIENDVPYETRCNIFKLLIKQNTKHKPLIYLNAISNAFDRRDLKELNTLFLLMNEEPDSDQIMLEKARILEISYNLLIGNQRNAESLLKQYISKWGKKNIPNFLPVADLSNKLGYSNNMIRKSAEIFRAFELSRTENYFEKIIKNKKIAIVGNGPQEIGSANGTKIDSYDVVLRFNGYVPAANTINDYGKKCTVIARWLGVPFPKTNFELLCQVEDIYFVRFGNKNIIDLYKYIKKGNRICYFHQKDVCKKNLNINTPTTGLQYLWWVKQINSNFSKNDCYGFSFKDKTINERNPNDFYNLNKNNSREPHDFNKEKEIILRILK